MQNMPQMAQMQANQAPQMPGMGAQPQPQAPGMPQGAPQASAQPSDDDIMMAIDQRMASVSPEQQDLVKKAILTIPELPQILQTIVGPPLVDFGGDHLAHYFTILREKMQGGEQNSQPQPQMAPGQPENPAQPAGQPAKATLDPSSLKL